MSAYTTAEFSFSCRWYWLTRTKAGIAIGYAALLGLLVGAVITAQTLYSATMAAAKEFATLLALGIPRRTDLRAGDGAIVVGGGVRGGCVSLPAVWGLAQAAAAGGAKVVHPLGGGVRGLAGDDRHRPVQRPVRPAERAEDSSR